MPEGSRHHAGTAAGTLRAVLEEARRRSLVGSGELDRQIAHAHGFAVLLRRLAVRGGSPVLDLGAGGGLPGLVVATSVPDAEVWLLEASARRCAFLRWAVEEMGEADRVEVVHGRAEDEARGPRRGRAGAVTSRSFGPPATTAECARGFLRDGGLLLVSEPPDARARWDGGGVSRLGYGPAEVHEVEGFHFAAMRASGPCPEAVPRRSGLPARRPLF